MLQYDNYFAQVPENLDFDIEKAMEEAIQSGKDIHRMTASKMFNVPYESVTYEQRMAGKNLNMLTLYNRRR